MCSAQQATYCLPLHIPQGKPVDGTVQFCTATVWSSTSASGVRARCNGNPQPSRSTSCNIAKHRYVRQSLVMLRMQCVSHALRALISMLSSSTLRAASGKFDASWRCHLQVCANGCQHWSALPATVARASCGGHGLAGG